jgi:hypothetical protein
MIIRREVLKAVLSTTGPDERGYALNSIQIRPDGACVATDGHLLLIARESDPMPDSDFPSGSPDGSGVLPAFKGNPETPIVIGRSHVEKLIAAMPKRSVIPILNSVQVSTNGEGGAVLSATDLQVPCSVHVAPDPTQRFPEYEKLIPTDRPELTVYLPVHVLESLIKAAKVLQGGSKSKTGGLVAFSLPTGPQHQGRKPADHEYEESPEHCSGKTCPCKHCGKIPGKHTVPNGIIEGVVIGVAMTGDGITVRGVAMPCPAL